MDIKAILGWRRFVKEPEATVESIVQEFYANAFDTIDNRVKVQCVLILFDPFDINSYQGLLDVGQDK